MEKLIKKREEIETKRKGILNSIMLAESYNKQLESKKINVQQYELQLQDVNKELKEINKLIGQYNVSKFEYPQEIKDLLHKAKENYKMQIQNIKNEYLKIKEMKENIGA